MTNILMSLFSEKEEWSSALEKYLAGKKYSSWLFRLQRNTFTLPKNGFRLMANRRASTIDRC